jgi:polar amino acid transport system ATP-binding protein
MVLANGVSKSYGNKTVLHDITMSVSPGEVVCLLGPSGSGKSTFLKCINHLEKIDDGQLFVDGELLGYRRTPSALRELRTRDLCLQRSQIGMVFQNFNLFPHMSVIENIIEAPMRVKREKRPAATAHARELLEQVGLADRADSFPRQLSGGQQQRVAIARALAMRPKLMLFDEATSALDPELVGEVLAVIRRLAQGGMTMILVTHEMAFAREVADKVVFMDDGRVIETGTPQQVMLEPRSDRAKDFFSRSMS